MRTNILWGVLAVLVLAVVAVFVLQPEDPVAQAEDARRIPVPGMVTMVDLGAKECIPCKMMAPILEELAKEYQGRAAVVFIDVWKDPAAGPKFGIRAIPTQIFYDAQGKEVTRHEGFLDKQAIVHMFAKLGVQ